MKYTTEQIGGIFTVIGAILFLTVKFWPSQILLIFDNIFIRFGVLLLLVWSIQYGIMPGMVVLAGVIMIFYERNQRKIAAVKQYTGGGANHGDSSEALAQLDADPTAPKSQYFTQPAAGEPVILSTDFLPKNSQQSNEFTEAGRDAAPETIPLGAAAGAVWARAAV